MVFYLMENFFLFLLKGKRIIKGKIISEIYMKQKIKLLSLN